jgi:hypothetical protein
LMGDELVFNLSMQKNMNTAPDNIEPNHV